MNLLTDPLLRVATQDGDATMSIPQLLEALGRDAVDGLAGIQRHQQDAFHVFLCCVAAAVLVRAGRDDARQPASFWETGLRELSAAGDDAWTLVVPDTSRPAFMQPPVPASDRFARAGDTPDALDLLPAPKNHDVKQERARSAALDEWVYALVSLQTMSGFFGQGNYGISRMNGGFGNRPIVELTNSLRMGARWQSAVARLMAHRESVLAGPWGYDPSGVVLVWEIPWDGRTALPLRALDPLYVEVCRRVRLVQASGRVEAMKLPSTSPRIGAEALHGVVGDPWLPVDTSGGKAVEAEKVLTLSAKGFTAELLRRLVFADGFRMSALQAPARDWRGDAWFVASALVRGQGTTEGFHERVIPVPAGVRANLFEVGERRKALADLARGAIEYAGVMHYRVLRPALRAYLQADARTGPGRDAEEAWLRQIEERFEHLWSDRLFPWLWRHANDADLSALEQDWCLDLRDHARSVLSEAMATLPTRTGRRYQARTAADSRFWRSLYWKDNFPFLKEEGPDGRTALR